MTDETEREADTRFFMYGPEGQSQIFNDPAEVPEDWYDHPIKAKAAERGEDPDRAYEAHTRGIPIKELDDSGEVDEGDGDAEYVLPEYDDITADQIKEKLDDLKVNYTASAGKPELYDALAIALAD